MRDDAPLKRRINQRFVLLAVLAALLMAGGVHLLHGHNVKRNADALRSTAERVLKEGDRVAAIRWFRQYTSLRPKDLDAQEQLARLLDEQAQTPLQLLEVYLKYETVLEGDANRDDLHNRQAEIAIALRKYDEAVEHLKLMLSTDPENGELEYRIGRCFALNHQPAEADRWYRSALEHGHTLPDVYLARADLLRRHLSQPEAADEVIDQMMAANRNSAAAYRARALYRRSLGELGDALSDAHEAAQLAPGDLEMQLLLAELVLADPRSSAERIEQVRQELAAELDAVEHQEQVVELLATVYLRQRNPRGAIEMFQRILAAHPQASGVRWRLADLLISEKRLDEAREELRALREAGTTETPLLYLEAQLHMAEGNLIQARNLFERARTRVSQKSPLFKQVGLQLGACYAQMGRPAAQLQACRRVLDIDPGHLQAQLGSAHALTQLGQFDAALQIYRRFQSAAPVSLAMARLLFRRNLRLPAHAQNWTEVEQLLDRAEVENPGAVDVALLRSDLLRVRGGGTDADELLESLRETHPDSVRAWTAAAMGALRQGDLAGSRKFLEQAQHTLGDSVPMRLAWAAWWNTAGGAEASDRLIELERGTDRFTRLQQTQLIEGLGIVHYLRGDRESARRLWQQVAEHNSDHLQTQLRLARLAIEADDSEEVELRLRELKRIDGEEGPTPLAVEALWLLARSKRGEEIVLSEPRVLLTRAAAERPDWNMIPLGLAEIYELEGNTAAALVQYQTAISLGNYDPQTLRRALQLHIDRGQIEAGVQFVNELKKSAPHAIQPLIVQLEIELQFALGNVEKALAAARPFAENSSGAAEGRAWYGRLLASAGRHAAAIPEFEKALDAEPGRLEIYQQLIASLRATGQTQAIETRLAELAQRYPGRKESLLMAACYEEAGRFDDALAIYRKRLALQTAEAAPTRQLAEFYLRTGNAQAAEPLLEKFLDPQFVCQDADRFWARRTLATGRSSRNYSAFLNSLELIDRNIAEVPDTLEDQRLKARLLASKPHPTHLKDARRILESLEARDLLLLRDRQLLAEICDLLADRDAADRHWQVILARQPENVPLLSAAVRRAVRQRRPELARQPLTQLLRLKPDSDAVRLLNARWLVLVNQPDAALKIIESYQGAEDEDSSKQSRVVAAASLAEELAEWTASDEARQQFLQCAETLYRQSAEESTEARLRLAHFLGRSGRLSDALSVLDQASREATPLQLASTAVLVARESQPSPEEAQQIERWLNRAVSQGSDPLRALSLVAEYHLFAERYEQSAEAYRQMLNQSPQHLVALNNLAWLLSMWKQNHAEAEQLIAQAIQIAGPMPPLVDTRGTIALNRGRVSQAINDYRDVVTQDASASNRFHLAIAYARARNERAARFHFEAALEAGLSVESLYPLERPAYAELAAIVGVPADSDASSSGEDDRSAPVAPTSAGQNKAGAADLQVAPKSSSTAAPAPGALPSAFESASQPAP